MHKLQHFKSDAAVTEGARAELDELCPILDAQLAGKAFIVGPLSVADFALGAYASVVPKGHYDFQRFAHVAGWIERVRGLKGFRATDMTAPERH